ncbi:hypothetical protein [Azospirillum palustre]
MLGKATFPGQALDVYLKRLVIRRRTSQKIFQTEQPKRK